MPKGYGADCSSGELLMSLRKRPCPTPALLAARRANALKLTDLHRPSGLDLGRVLIPRSATAGRWFRGGRLARAGYRHGKALYCRIRKPLLKIFGAPDEVPSLDVDPNRQVGRLGNSFGFFSQGCAAWDPTRAKLECPLNSVSRIVRLTNHTRIVTDHYFTDNNPQLDRLKGALYDASNRVILGSFLPRDMVIRPLR